MGSCGFCKADSPEKLLKCGSCGGESYCSKVCQAKHWVNHKASCPPYRVKEVPGKGRGLFATRKIIPGKIILEERPLITMKDTSVIETSDFSTIDGETKARILQLHDPADSLDHLLNLSSEKVDVGQLIRDNPTFFKLCSINDEVCKIQRIFINNCIAISPISEAPNAWGEVMSNTPEAALYNQISLINHSCDPNVYWTNTWGDINIKGKLVRAVKVIEKGEEILATYHSEPFGSRDTRQKTLLKTHQFLCQCSQCSLEGEALQENEKMRAEIREKKEKINSLMNTSPSILHLYRRNVKKAVKPSQELMERLRKLNLPPQIALNLLLTALPVAWSARRLGLRAPDPDGIKEEALQFCQKFGESWMILYNKMSKDCP